MKPQELKLIAILQGLSDEVLSRLAAVLEEQRFAAGDRIFAEGDPGDAMYLIQEGMVRVEKAADATGATSKILAVLAAGDYLGEMSLFERKPRSASAVAADAVRLLRLSGPAFDRVLQENPTAALSVLFGMLRTASDRLRRLSAGVIVYDEIGKAMGEAKTLQGLLEVVLRQLCHGTQADWGLLLLKAQFAERLEFRSSENLALTPAQKDELSEAKGLIGRVLASRRELLVRNFNEDETLKADGTIGFESPSMLLAPTLLGEEILGLIALGHQKAGHFDLNHLNLAQGVARQTAQAIVNARHREEEESRARLERRFVRF